MDPHARIGFSAHGVLRRSEFGIAYGIPPAGSTMGVSDGVEVQLELEFSGPPLAAKTCPLVACAPLRSNDAICRS